MRELACHILEGSSSSGTHYFACGRKVPRSRLCLYVGRAVLEKQGYQVTCKACRKKYAAALCLPQAETPKGDE